MEAAGLIITVYNLTPSRIGIIAEVFLYCQMVSSCACRKRNETTQKLNNAIFFMKIYFYDTGILKVDILKRCIAI